MARISCRQCNVFTTKDLYLEEIFLTDKRKENRERDYSVFREEILNGYGLWVSLPNAPLANAKNAITKKERRKKTR
jgi:hypothetical protein